MTDLRRVACTVVAALGVCLVGWTARPAGRSQETEFITEATPPVGFTPLRVVVVVDVKDGSDDYADFYCAGVEWDWGDGTISENSSDCDPYEAGKSTIRRRFTADHVYRQQGQFKVISS